MAKLARAAEPTRQSQAFSPELFRYEAFNGHDEGGLSSVLRALEKLSRLAALAQRGARASEVLVGDAELLDELASAVECAAMHARAIHGEAA
jgi:hypothetical protein